MQVYGADMLEGVKDAFNDAIDNYGPGLRTAMQLVQDKLVELKAPCRKMRRCQRKNL